MSLGIIFYQNEEGDVLDIQADIIGPGKLHGKMVVINETSVK